MAIESVRNIPDIGRGVGWVVDVVSVGRGVVGAVAGEIAGFGGVAMAGEDHDFAGVVVAGDEDALFCVVCYPPIRHAVAAPAVAGATREDAEIDFRRAVEDIVVAGVV